MRYFLLCLFAIIIWNADGQPMPSLQWVNTLGSPGDSTHHYENIGHQIVLDKDQNVYVTGMFKGPLDFDPSPNGTALGYASNASQFFVTKSDSNGNLLWVRYFNSPEIESSGMDIKIDDNGNLVILLFIYNIGYGPIDTDPGLGLDTITPKHEKNEMLLLKLNSVGDYVWCKHFTGNSPNFIFAYCNLSINQSGDFFISGYFNGKIDFDPGPDTAQVTTISSNGFFVLKLTSNGDYCWAKVVQRNGSIFLSGMAVDQQDNIYLSGYYSDTTDFDPGPNVYNLTSFHWSNEFSFISKLDSSGSFLWAKQYGRFGNFSTTFGVLTLDDSNNIFVLGTSADSVDFDNGPGFAYLQDQDKFLLKLNNNGDYQWVKKIASKLTTNNYDLSLSCVTTDHSGNAYVSGQFRSSYDFNPDSTLFVLTSCPALLSASNPTDAFIAKYKNDGNFLWAINAASGTRQERSSRLLVDDQDNIYNLGGMGLIWSSGVGTFIDTVDFDPGPSTYFLNSLGKEDIYIQKLGQKITPLQTSSWSQESILYIYPNPSKKVFNFLTNTTDAILDVYAISGAKMFSVPIRSNIGSFDLSSFPAGIYTVQLREKNKTIARQTILKN